MVQEAKATRRKARGIHNPVDMGLMAMRYRRRKAADGVQVHHPKDDVMGANRGTSWMQGLTEQTEPRHRRTDWNAVDWCQAQRSVRNSETAIFRATQARATGRKVHSFQKLMVRSYANTAVERSPGDPSQYGQIHAGRR